jgi:hypothetical protein
MTSTCLNPRLKYLDTRQEVSRTDTMPFVRHWRSAQSLACRNPLHSSHLHRALKDSVLVAGGDSNSLWWRTFDQVPKDGHGRFVLTHERQLKKTSNVTKLTAASRPVASSPHTDVLLETLAQTETSTRNAARVRRPASSGHPTRPESQRALAHGQDDCQRRWYDERLASRSRSLESKDIMERTCSSSLNRRMRTRMSGGVGRAVSNDRPYPISSKTGGPTSVTDSRIADGYLYIQ